MLLRNLSLLAVVTAVLVGSAAADDFMPPQDPANWARGDDGTTYQRWEFDANSQVQDNGWWVYDPNEMQNPYGDSRARFQPGIFQPRWIESDFGRNGLLALGGVVELDVPNRPELLPFKEIWLQLTWYAEIAQSDPIVSVVIDGQQTPCQGPVFEESADANGWMHSVYLMHIEPNPDFEIVRIEGNILLDEIVLDTICAPEPATLGTLCVAGLWMVLRRRKR
ncbi:MAG: PEP-CTERM sorting domain-containing protein [Phycisphaerae bacterium]